MIDADIDLLFGCNVPKEMAKILLEPPQQAAQGVLNKMVSNSRTQLLSMSEENQSKEIKDVDFEQDILPVETD